MSLSPPSSPPPPPPPTNLATCPHGLRPGTTTCLYCRQEARAAARQRRHRLAARVGIVTLGGGALIALSVGGLIAIADARRSPTPPAPTPSTSPAPAPRVLQPIIAEGRSHLGDSIFAERKGAEVIVHFDTDTLRTRYDWKFEGVVRATLPVVFGPDARRALDAIPSGTFVRGGHLLRELPERGLTLALPSHGRTLRVWPMTRPGRDGLIVVAYRAAVAH